MIRRSTLAVLIVAAPAWAQLPEPGHPACLTELRWLARPAVGERVVVDTFTADGAPAEADDQAVVADIPGPGVLDHLICGQVGELALVVDGQEVLRCEPNKSWKRMYIAPKPEERGDLPFAFPLVHLAGPYAHCALPVPFRDRLIVRTTQGQDQLWLTYRRLDAAAKIAFSAAPDSPYIRALSATQPWLVQPVQDLVDCPGATEHEVECHCPAGERSVLAELDGPAEVVGIRLRVLPGAHELLRYQVIELTADSATCLRMPLVDLIGVSHPWPHAWQPRAGSRVAGLVHPVYYGGGWAEPAIVVYFKLPIPFAKSLRIELWNRSPRLPVTYEAKVRIAPLEDDVARVARLCGTSRRLQLPPEGPVELFSSDAPGRLLGLSMFTTGHGPDWDWRRHSYAQLTVPDGADAGGVGLLPLAMQGTNANTVIAALSWNHNSLEPTGRCGASRHFWTDPFDLHPGSAITYTGIGKDGPTNAEVGVLWYQWPDAPYTAPEVPPEVVTLPPVHHPQPKRPLPGGWWDEAETFAASAQATAGEVRSETVGARDVFASRDAYLAWNADRPGDALDLIAPMPESRYARLWIHRLLFAAGGTFAIELTGPDDTEPRFGYEKTPGGFLDRVLGRVKAPASVDCYDFWPHRQAYRFDMPPVLNPAPGRLGRIRFTCVTKPLASRGYLLALDQLGIDPPPPTPEGWREIESAARSAVPTATAPPAALQASHGPLTAELMQYGRADFHGWGGRALIARGPASITFTLAQFLAGPAAEAIELRGLVHSGEWTAAIDGGAPQAITSPEKPKEPSVWRLPLPEPRDMPAVLTLTVSIESPDGRLLLDAWRPAGPR